MKIIIGHSIEYWRAGLPTVYEVDELPDERRYVPDNSLNLEDIAARLRKLASRGHAAIGVSEKVREYLADEIGFRKAYCIPNGSDPEMFGPALKTFETEEALQVV